MTTPVRDDSGPRSHLNRHVIPRHCVSAPEIKERNRRALLGAALQVVSRDGHRARLDEITELAGLTTGAVYSLFGSKNDGLLAAMTADNLRPRYAEIARAVPEDADLLTAVEAFAGHYRRSCDGPMRAPVGRCR